MVWKNPTAPSRFERKTEGNREVIFQPFAQIAVPLSSKKATFVFARNRRNRGIADALFAPCITNLPSTLEKLFLPRIITDFENP
jgi:hypothetical protein